MKKNIMKIFNLSLLNKYYFILFYFILTVIFKKLKKEFSALFSLVLLSINLLFL